VPAASNADIDAAVTTAGEATSDRNGWAYWAPERRAAALESLADELTKRGDMIAELVSAQNGMPISIARQLEQTLPPMLLRYYADVVCKQEAENTRPHLLGGSTTVYRAPVGVVAAIAPWNFPQALSATKYAPALAAGCAVVLKPSPETVLDAYCLAEAVAASDLPEGIFSVVPCGPEVSEYLVTHPGVSKVAFTGSTAVGRKIGAACGPLLRPVTLELGGKSAAIILDDADLDLTVVGERLFGATLLNNGQTCFVSTRILAPRSRYDEVVDTFATLAASLTIGDALDPNTQIGPLVNKGQREQVEAAITAAVSRGARLVTGGRRPANRPAGWFLEPTVLADITNSDPVAREEVFGPVLTVIAYDDDEDAIRIANDSDYGLAGSVWTADAARGIAMARRIQSGTVGVNGYIPDPGAPFGGMKASGIGRELGPQTLESYQITQSVYH
jgi:acyl-CoA reductase-like NAD-dependent aldehyde dehydrogenase